MLMSARTLMAAGIEPVNNGKEGIVKTKEFLQIKIKFYQTVLLNFYL